MKTPKVTISIPTLNSEKTITLCLEEIKKQDYKNIEINVIDGKSSDNTLNVAKKYKVEKIKQITASLLQSRYEGVKIATGKYVLILDSDQILERSAISRAVKIIEKEKLDMLVLEEKVYSSKTFVEKLFDFDRKVINKVNDLSPFTGVIMPRFYKTKILRKAYDNIPKYILPKTGGPDHAIVYYESWLLSKKIGVLKNGVRHIEPKTIAQIWKKCFRWGYTSVEAHYGKYSKLMEQKERLRTGLFTKGLIVESIGSILLLLLKGIPYKLGLFLAGLKRSTKNDK